MKKLVPFIVLLLISDQAFSQATFPVTNKRIVTEVWCDFLATKIKSQAEWWADQHNVKYNKTAKERKQRVVDKIRTMNILTDQSTTYKNLCESSVYILLKDTLKKLMPTMSP